MDIVQRFEPLSTVRYIRTMYEQLRKRAIYFRKKGYSYNLIKEKISVSKSTLSNWLREISYTPNKIVKQRVTARLLQFIMSRHKNKLYSIIQIKKATRTSLLPITLRDLQLFGLGLYLGEGTKAFPDIRIVNSDPCVIRIILLWFEKIYQIPRSHFAIRIHLYPDSNEEEAIRYWSRITRLPKNQFYSSQFDKRVNKSGKNHNKLRYGTVHISVKSLGNPEFGVKLHRKILSSFEIIFENFGCSNRRKIS